FVTKALEPAKLKSIEVDEPRKRLNILVAEDQLSLAIGKRGQNARLTAKLTGWEVDIDAEEIVTKGFEEKVAEAIEALAVIPGITREQADALVHAGLTRLEDLMSADESDLSSIPQIGEKAGEVLKAVRSHGENGTLPVNS
ncbi:MAG: helix-hairpin-helix domain-containing protein, partial [Limisphaerales bacterium]